MFIKLFNVSHYTFNETIPIIEQENNKLTARKILSLADNIRLLEFKRFAINPLKIDMCSKLFINYYKRPICNFHGINLVIGVHTMGTK
jgi:hypothetical protein